METKTYRVEGMTCGGCASSVTRAIQAVDSAAAVDVDLEKKEVAVAGQLDAAAVRDAVEGAGFDFGGLID